MIQIKPTKNLAGITFKGDYNDFNDLMHSIYNMTGLEEDATDLYYGVKIHLLGLCYDIRHAFMGDREIVLEDNGMTDETMKWHNMITPKQNVYYSVNILFPQAIFIAASVPNIYFFSRGYYGKTRQGMGVTRPPIPFADYLRDKANLDVLCAGIWQALGEVIGDEELEKIIKLMQRNNERYMNYATQYIDKCDVELLKAAVDKRKDKLRNIAKRIVKKTQAYYNIEESLRYWAREYQTNIYELSLPDLEYPEIIEW